MADHPGGYDLSKEQAVLMVCSTQVRFGIGCRRALRCGGWLQGVGVRTACSPHAAAEHPAINAQLHNTQGDGVLPTEAREFCD